MRRKLLSFIAVSPTCCMLLLFCLISHTGFGQLLPTNTNPNLDLLYSLLLCTPLPGTDSKSLANTNDSMLHALSIADSIALNDSTVETEMQEALHDAETEMLVERFAEMIEEEPQELSNLRLYRFIDDWYGVRYKYGGTTIRGIDCSAFSQKVYNQIFCTTLRRTSRSQYKHCKRIKHYEDAVEGDLVFFRIHRTRISHVGIYLANGYFVHASRSKGVMISSLSDRYWQRRYAGCGRMSRPIINTSESGMAARN